MSTTAFAIQVNTPASPTVTVTVTRTDTAAVLLNAVALTAVSTGLYELVPPLTDPAAGLVYDVVWLVNGVDRFEARVLGGTNHWGTINGIQMKYGRDNATKSANTEGDEPPDLQFVASRYEAALTAADNRITLRAAELRVAIPSVGTLTPYTLYFSEFANIYAGAWLSSGRGQPLEAGFQEFGEYQAMVNSAEARLTGSLMGLRELNGMTGVHVSAVTALGQGSNRQCLPQPYRWGWPGVETWR